MTRLFDRTVEITAGTVKATGLRMAFQIVKTLKPEPNTCELRIYNMKEDNRKALEASPIVPVKIVAGYAENASQIFLGEMRRVWSEIDGLDIVTILTSGDGEKKAKKSRVNKSYPKLTPVKQVAKDLAKTLGVSDGNIEEALAIAALKGTADVTLKRGTVLSGNTARELTQLLRAAGFEWSIQDGAIQVLAINASLRSLAVKLTSSTGLLGSPSVDNEGVLTAVALMIPELQPGRVVSVESRFINGSFRCESTTFTGDTHGDDWYVEIEAKRY